MNPPTLLKHFSDLPDQPIDRSKQQELIDIIGITICVVLGGCSTWTDIEEFAEIREDWFREFLMLPNIPSHDTLSRVFKMLSPQHFQQAFTNWTKAVKQVFDQEVVAIDGKCLRGSQDIASGKAAIHMVSAWVDSNRLIPGQVKTDEKSNEITAIPKLLETLALNGSCNKATCNWSLSQSPASPPAFGFRLLDSVPSRSSKTTHQQKIQPPRGRKLPGG